MQAGVANIIALLEEYAHKKLISLQRMDFI